MMKQKLLSIILLIVVFLLGLSASLLFKEKWQCPICSFDAAERIVPLINNQYSSIVFNELSKAESEIDIAIYEMRFYETNNSVRRIEDLLISKSRQGVKVNVIFEQGEWQGRITELTKDNKESADYLESGGVNVKFDSLKTTTHDKLVIIDDKTVVLGSHNWGYSALERNNEASVLIESPDIAEYYKDYFDNLWNQF